MKNGSDKELDDNFYTPKEGAAYMRVSMLTFYKYLKKPRKKGGPPVRRFGRNCIRLPKEKFIAWANNGNGA